MVRFYSGLTTLVIIFSFGVLLFSNSSNHFEVTGTLINETGSAVTRHQVFLYNERDELIAGEKTDSEGRFTLQYEQQPTSADPHGSPESPTGFRLGSSYPNPFNPKTTVPFHAPESARVSMILYTVLGQEVMRTQAEVSPGSHEIEVNLGGRLSQGQYLLRVQGDGFSKTAAMTFVSAGISSGEPGIRVRPAGRAAAQLSGSDSGGFAGNVSTDMPSADEPATYRLVIAGTGVFREMEVAVPANQDHDVETLTLLYRDDVVFDSDGNVYPTVPIGDQVWMAKNLRVTHYRDSTEILTGLSDSEWDAGHQTREGAYAIYPHEDIEGIDSAEQMIRAYGLLYNWYAVYDQKGLCPEGWRVPSEEDWSTLLAYVESVNSEGFGNQLKSCRQVDSPLAGDCDTSEHPRWNTIDAQVYGTDDFGFSGLPSGNRTLSGRFYAIGSITRFWGSTGSSDNTQNAYSLGLNFSVGDVNPSTNPKWYGFSVRCIKGADPDPDPEPDPDAFVTTWDTNLGDGTTVTLALAGQVNVIIDWGDGTVTPVTTAGPHTHDYGTDGIYTVSVTGSATAYNSMQHGGVPSERQKLTRVDNWGTLGFTSLAYAFNGASNLTYVPGHSDGIEEVTNMSFMFNGTAFFNHDIGGWNTDNVTLMESMFHGASTFNQDIGGWNTSNVTTMRNMFRDAITFDRDIGGWNTENVIRMDGIFQDAKAFNQDIGGWNTSNATHMTFMFAGASAFNQDIGGWDVSNVVNMVDMFASATAFNQDIGGWNTENVTRMDWMFSRAPAFNQDIGGWNTSNVTNMEGMFDLVTAFNQDIGRWDTGNVTNMRLMFRNARAFNQDIGGWNTSNVRDMSSMFEAATAFNQDIGSWNTESVTNMNSLFHNASSFNQDIGAWNTENVTNMNSLFRAASAFNQDIDGWDVSNVTDMSLIFREAHAFNQDIGGWDVSNVTRMSQMFHIASSFNQDIGSWNTSNVTNMSNMFNGAYVFDHDIGDWDVSNVADMRGMFNFASAFNQDLSRWCVSQIATQPENFDTNANNWVLPRPLWGTCPE